MTSITGMERDTMMAYRSEEDWDIASEGGSSMKQSVVVTFSRMNWRRASLLFAFCTWGVIGYNALYAQPGPHPAPFFFGDSAPARNTPAPVRTGRVAPADPAGPVRMPAAQGVPGVIDETVLVRQIQDALYQRGYDIGEIDGLMGPRTRAAIAAFERDMGLAETGIPSSELLIRLGLDPQPVSRSAAPAQSPAVASAPPKQQKSEISRVLEMAGPARTPAATPAARTSSRTVTTTTVRIDDLIAGAAPGGADPSLVPVPSAPVGDPMVAQIQTILANLGYAPGKIDGFVGPGTRDAIARFRADRGLPPSDGLSADLVAELSSVAGVTIVR